MADKKISEQTSLAAATGDERFPVAEPDGVGGFLSRYILGSALATYITALIVDSAPGTLDTLNELAAALGDDASFAATMTAALAGKQPLDTDLTAIGALVSAADKVPYATGSGTWALADFSSYGRTIAALANASALAALIESWSVERPNARSIKAIANSTTWSTDGLATPSALGTAAAVGPANTNYLTRRPRITYTSLTTADAQAGIRTAAYIFRVDGFRVVLRAGVSQLPTSPRLFMGLYASSGAQATGEPSALINTIYFGCDSTDTTIHLYSNDASGTATNQHDTSIALAAGGYYEAKFECEAGGSTVLCTLRRLDTGDSYSLSISTDLPATTTALHPHITGALNGTNTGTAIIVDASAMFVRGSA